MKYVIANWKMNLAVREAIALTRGMLRAVQGKDSLPCIVICPSFTALAEVHKLVARTHLALGAQNIGIDRSGAYTGEVGVAQLEDLGCTYAIIGHSDRRLRFGETDELIHDRLAATLSSKLTPVVCVGESKEMRATGQAQAQVLRQLKAAFTGQKFGRNHLLMVAYEPVWAIGTGQSATVEQVLPMHEMIRDYLMNDLGCGSDNVVVLYGGSVDGKNAYQFLRESQVDGVLVGSASLKINEFTKIFEAAQEVMEAQRSV